MTPVSYYPEPSLSLQSTASYRLFYSRGLNVNSGHLLSPAMKVSAGQSFAVDSVHRGVLGFRISIFEVCLTNEPI